MDASKQTDGQAAGAIMNPEAPTATATDPALENAIRNGYVEEPVPSRNQRIATLSDALDHALDSNSPMTMPMIEEIKALLRGE